MTTRHASEIAAAWEKRIRDEFPNLDVDVEVYGFKRFIRWRVSDRETRRSLRSDPEKHLSVAYAEHDSDLILQAIRDWLAKT